MQNSIVANIIIVQEITPTILIIVLVCGNSYMRVLNCYDRYYTPDFVQVYIYGSWCTDNHIHVHLAMCVTYVCNK